MGRFKLDEYEGELSHIGIAKRSGRYPWGSGQDPYQRSKGFKAYMDDMKAKGLTERGFVGPQDGAGAGCGANIDTQH